jgi:hypothetical protein
MKGHCCVDHGPGCTKPNHVQIGLEAWRSLQGLCGECGGPGTIKWGQSVQVARGHYTLRCERCVLTAQLEHARESAAAIPELEAKLASLPAAVSVPEHPKGER